MKSGHPRQLVISMLTAYFFALSLKRGYEQLRILGPHHFAGTTA